METISGEKSKTRARGPRATFARILICAAAIASAAPHSVAGTEPNALAPKDRRHSRGYFRTGLAATVRAEHPAILPVAAAIRAVTTDPLEQIVMVNDVTHLLVDYDNDERVYGSDEFHATLEEMLARRREQGWLYLRDDCDGRAIFAAHLLASLGIEWRLEASYWKEHAWVTARVNGVDYDLLDLRRNAPETNRLSFKLMGRHFVRESVRPPSFAWRRAWALRTDRNNEVGLRLGMLTPESTPEDQRERNSMDWTSKAPGKTLPFDDRALAASTAAFPLGEPLKVSALAHTPRIPVTPGLTVGVATASRGASPAETPVAK